MRHIILSFLFIVGLSSVAAAQYKCGLPANDEVTRPGANELITRVLPKTYQSINGIAQDIHGKPMKGILIEVFDNPEWIREGHTKSPVEQRRVAVLKTGRNGKFCFNDLPSGNYELRLSYRADWNNVHIYVQVNRENGKAIDDGIRIVMYPGI